MNIQVNQYDLHTPDFSSIVLPLHFIINQYDLLILNVEVTKFLLCVLEGFVSPMGYNVHINITFELVTQVS